MPSAIVVEEKEVLPIPDARGPNMSHCEHVFLRRIRPLDFGVPIFQDSGATKTSNVIARFMRLGLVAVMVRWDGRPIVLLIRVENPHHNFSSILPSYSDELWMIAHGMHILEEMNGVPFDNENHLFLNKTSVYFTVNSKASKALSYV